MHHVVTYSCGCPTGVLPNHPCVLSGEETYLPHPGRCHWFYNCTAPFTDSRASGVDLDGWDGLTEECPYPSLFSLVSHTCQHYTAVDCGTRGLFLDPCQLDFIFLKSLFTSYSPFIFLQPLPLITFSHRTF